MHASGEAASKFSVYRVFEFALTDFEDLKGQLKTTFMLCRRYISEVEVFEFHQTVFKK